MMMEHSEYKNLVHEACNYINKKVNAFANIEFELNPKFKDEEVSIDLRIHSLSANSSLNNDIINKLLEIIKKQLNLYLNDFEKITERMFDNFIEDICIELVFNTCINQINKYNEVYSFIKQLEEIAG